MSLFDNVVRTSDELAAYSELDFDYLNRTSRPDADEMRKNIERWFEMYKNEQPNNEADRLFRDFRTSDPKRHHISHYNALTELYVYSRLREAGYQVETHPNLSNGSSHRPDFFCLFDRKPSCYVEVSTIVSTPKRDVAERYAKTILDRINTIDSVEFLISVEFMSIGNDAPQLKNLILRISEILKTLNYTEEVRSEKIFRETKKYIWENGGWKLRIRFTPVTFEARGRRTSASRNIGTISFGVRFIDLDEVIKRKIVEKSSYGHANLPFLLAINVIKDGIFLDDYTVMSALFGAEVVTVSFSPDGSEQTKWGRTREGAWVYKNSIQGTRFSGLWFIKGLTVFKQQPETKIWLHPQATIAYNEKRIHAGYMIHNPVTDTMELTAE